MQPVSSRLWGAHSPTTHMLTHPAHQWLPGVTCWETCLSPHLPGTFHDLELLSPPSLVQLSWLLWPAALSAFPSTTVCRFSCKHTASFWGYLTIGEMLGYLFDDMFCFAGCCQAVSRAIWPLFLPAMNSSCSRSTLEWRAVIFLHCSLSKCFPVVSHWYFNLHFPNDCCCGELFTCLFAFCVSSFAKCLLHIFELPTSLLD